MKAIILAAGRGSRLKSLTENIPKPMVTLNNRPLLDYQITAMQDAGITDIGVVVGYQKDKIKHPALSRRFENKFWQNSNMVTSLFQADEWLSHDNVIISYGDIFYQSSAIKSLIDCNDDIAITYDINFLDLWQKRFKNPLDDLESFCYDSQSYLTDIGQKPQDYSDIQGQYMGLLKFTPQGWSYIKNIVKNININTLDMTSFLQILIKNNIMIKAIPYAEKWGEIDHISDLKLYEQ